MPPPSASDPTPVDHIDLTTAPAASTPPSTPVFPSYSSPMRPHRPAHFTSAYRRIYSRRDRVYTPSTPGRSPAVVAERLDVTEEAPPSPFLHARSRALSHLAVAYAAAGYAHSALCVVVSLSLAALVTAFSRGLYADVTRKTRLRADALAIEAAECLLARTANACVLDDTGASHPTPALDALCKKWLACERRATFADVDAVSASVWAETFAETVNSFADRISSTAVVLALAAAVVVAFIMSSAAFGFMHKRIVGERVTGERSLSQAVLERDDQPFGGSLAASPRQPCNRAITFGQESPASHRRSPVR